MSIPTTSNTFSRRNLNAPIVSSQNDGLDIVTSIRHPFFPESSGFPQSRKTNISADLVFEAFICKVLVPC